MKKGNQKIIKGMMISAMVSYFIRRKHVLFLTILLIGILIMILLKK